MSGTIVSVHTVSRTVPVIEVIITVYLKAQFNLNCIMDTTTIIGAGGNRARVQSLVDVDVSHSLCSKKTIIICNLDVQLEGSLE